MSVPSRQRTSQVSPSWVRWLGYGALVVVFAIACVFLSRWQFARLDDVRAEISRVDANYDAEPVPINDVIRPNSDLNPTQEWRPVVVAGEYVPELQVLVRNRVNNSATGYHIISPLRTMEGVIFVVDRGWIPLSDDAATPVAIPALPSGPVVVVVRLRLSEPVLSGQSDTPTLISSIHVRELAAEWKLPTFTGAYGALSSVTPPGVNGILATRPSIGEGNHLSYALQWIAFAILAFVALVWAVRQERRIRSGAPRRVRPQRNLKKLSDDEVEDALVDAALRHK